MTKEQFTRKTKKQPTSQINKQKKKKKKKSNPTANAIS